jgi:hypothetical protein
MGTNAGRGMELRLRNIEFSLFFTTNPERISTCARNKAPQRHVSEHERAFPHGYSALASAFKLMSLPSHRGGEGGRVGEMGKGRNEAQGHITHLVPSIDWPRMSNESILVTSPPSWLSTMKIWSELTRWNLT